MLINNISMEEFKLNVGHKYLIKRGSSISMYEVLHVTETSYHFKYEAGTTGWMEMKEFNAWYVVIEDITDFMVTYTK